MNSSRRTESLDERLGPEAQKGNLWLLLHVIITVKMTTFIFLSTLTEEHKPSVSHPPVYEEMNTKFIWSPESSVECKQ